jgi:predicted transglutaminase-like cysteine proteinase
MTPKLWRTVKDVNAAVNARALDEFGKRLDCVGYVKRKRSALIAAGVPAEAMSAAIVVTPSGLSHTLLILSTEAGDVVLDNLEYDVVKWNRTDYVWVEREIAGPTKDGATRWAWISRPAGGPTVRAMSR